MTGVVNWYMYLYMYWRERQYHCVTLWFYVFGDKWLCHDNLTFIYFVSAPIWKYVTGASVHKPRQSNSTYGEIVIQYIYDTRRPEHPHRTIHPVPTTPSGTCFVSLLHGILTVSRTRYVYVYVYSPDIFATVAISMSILPCYKPAHCHIWSSVIGVSSFSGHRIWPDFTHDYWFD